jgi:hypothetical protein
LNEGDERMSTNGNTPQVEPSAADAIAALRTRPANVMVFRGFGTLVAGVILFVLMLWLAPSVAPEHIVERPVTTPTTVAP